MQQNCQIIEPLTEKTWGRGGVVMVVTQNGGTCHSFHEEEIDELLAKNTARTNRKRNGLEGRHLLFAEFLRRPFIS